MAGVAPEIGATQSVGQAALTGALAGILGALQGRAPAAAPTVAPAAAPSIARPALIAGIPVTTALLIVAGVLVVMKLAR
ncbi:MAG: hypothetical protein GTN49_07575 [candidate division Zixibacteria bacterium]|nr:hypothetical protein [candidate division Zixibacteria bacterium]